MPTSTTRGIMALRGDTHILTLGLNAAPKRTPGQTRAAPCFIAEHLPVATWRTPEATAKRMIRAANKRSLPLILPPVETSNAHIEAHLVAPRREHVEVLQ